MQAFKQPYLCLSAQEYRIEAADEKGNKTGEIIEGVSVRYIPDNELYPREDAQAAERGQINRGIKVAKMTLPLAAKPQLHAFPAIYNIEFEMAIVGDKPQLKAKSLEFAATVKLIQEKAG